MAFTAVLVAVPLAASETAEAHTKTERRCTYNRQLSRPECQDVHVSHTHTDNTPEGRNGDSDGPRNGGIHTPATTAPPPTTAPRQCSAGSHRYGNGCHSHGFTPPCGTGTWTPHAGHTTQQRPACPPPPKCADGYSGTPPNCKKIEPPKCPASTTGTPPNCVKDKPKTCPAGQTGTPPNCQTPPPPPTTTTAPPPQCSTDEHRHANRHVNGCHRDHVPPCGVGTWDPGHGHERVDRSACVYSDASHTMGPITYCGTQSHTHKTRHSHYGGNGCHPVADVHPDPPDPTRYTGANACANWAEDLIAAINTNSSPLPDRPADCKSMTTAEIAGVARVVIARFGSAIGGALKKVLEYQGEAVEGESEAYAELGQEIKKLWDKTPAEAKAFIEGFVKSAGCGALILVIAKTTVATAGAAAPAWLVTLSTPGGALVATAACGGAIEAAEVAVKNWGKGDGSDDDSGEDADPEPEADPKPTAAEIKQNDDELNEATRRYWAKEITLVEYQAAFRRWARWRCEEMGETGWCNR